MQGVAMTPKAYNKRLKETHPHIKCVGEFTKSSELLEHYCTVHKIKWKVRPSSFTRKIPIKGCRLCRSNTDDLTGKVFGRLTVVKPSNKKNTTGEYYWICKCECGNTHKTVGRNLKDGATKSCGCLNVETREKHGMHKSEEYRIWQGILDRCYNKNRSEYYRYGGRGIKVCRRWRTGENNEHPFLCFLADMGERPSKEHSVDRINNSGNYTPSNCKWATKFAQERNKRTNIKVVYKGKQMILADAVFLAGIVSYDCALARYHKGWSVKRAVETPTFK